MTEQGDEDATESTRAFTSNSEHATRLAAVIAAGSSSATPQSTPEVPAELLQRLSIETGARLIANPRLPAQHRGASPVRAPAFDSPTYVQQEASASGPSTSWTSTPATAPSQSARLLISHQDADTQQFVISCGPGFFCSFVYDSDSDFVVISNRSNAPLRLEPIPAGTRHDGALEAAQTIMPKRDRSIKPGIWRLSAAIERDTPFLDFIISSRQFAAIPVALEDHHLPDANVPDNEERFEALPGISVQSVAMKRTAEEDEMTSAKRVCSIRVATGGALLPPVSLPDTKQPVNPLVAMQPSGAVRISRLQPSSSGPGVYIEEYMMTSVATIASRNSTQVFQAMHSGYSAHGLVVVKVLKKMRRPGGSVTESHDTAETLAVARQFAREVASHTLVSAEPSHPSIVRLFGADARFLAMFMESVHAPDLTTYRHPQSGLCTIGGHEAHRVLRDISSALQHVHCCGILHNDIKPGNILFSITRGAVLIDFGLATPIAAPPSLGGTPWYTPPEMLAARQRGTPADVWALGVTMLFVLGHTPLPERIGVRRGLDWRIGDVLVPAKNSSTAMKTMAKWLEYVRNEALRDPDDVWLDALVRRMLDPDPETRASVAEVVKAVGELTEEPGV